MEHTLIKSQHDSQSSGEGADIWEPGSGVRMCTQKKERLQCNVESTTVMNIGYTTRMPLAKSSNFSPSGMYLLSEWLECPPSMPGLLH